MASTFKAWKSITLHFDYNNWYARNYTKKHKGPAHYFWSSIVIYSHSESNTTFLNLSFNWKKFLLLDRQCGLPLPSTVNFLVLISLILQEEYSLLTGLQIVLLRDQSEVSTLPARKLFGKEFFLEGEPIKITAWIISSDRLIFQSQGSAMNSAMIKEKQFALLNWLTKYVHCVLYLIYL